MFLRIAVVYGAPHHLNWIGISVLLRSLEELGHEVDRYNIMDQNGHYEFTLLDPLLDNRNHYDLVIVFDIGRIRTDKIHKRHYKCIVVGEMGDDPQNFKDNLRCADQYDILLTPQRQMIPLYQAHGFQRVYWWTHCFDQKVHRKVDGIVEEWDVCTAMTPYGKRRKNLFALQTSPYRFENGHGLWGEEYSRFLQSGKIVFNQSNHREITRRVFEALGSGCFLITDRIPAKTGCYKLFTPGEDLVIFWNRWDLFRKIRYYLRYPRERERIAENGYRKAMANHSGFHRARQILEIAKEWM